MEELDRISDLPTELKENILVRLPVKEAVRTCCLSSNWRLAWSSIPEFVYDIDKYSISTPDILPHEYRAEDPVKMVQFVDNFLASHDGSIRKFVIIADGMICSEALDRWIGVLLRKEIEEFRITFHNWWKVPSTFWNLQCLREVVLRCSKCTIELPRAFKGFKLLKSLGLSRYLMYKYDMELSIKFYHLRTLLIKMNFACQREASVVRQLFRRAPNLQKLTVEEANIYYAYTSVTSEEWAQYTVLENLKFVEINNFFDNHKAVLLFVEFLLASTPVLEELHFEKKINYPEFFQKLLRLKRTSKKAKIILPKN
ncbi:F-box/RNI/FBD-like domain protein [Rhynchospora pubera]|uniref:F-box/RNI/FBD-like domain protein n=1 Tax=Rhynchospora pubera TaxID=906938 RepID=A0AAV8BTL4_9POAL|nr:F-box/RNI/FBD-like domain protein [Rhynchospora pubera]